jgi:D-tyrosyl-tRNA(Tyr) deacylase
VKALIQRVTTAQVSVDGAVIGAIASGLLVLLGVERDDDSQRTVRMADKLLAYRVFPDAEQRMNRNVVEAGGGLLVVSQFTLAADTGKGLRPNFSGAAAPALAEQLYEQLISTLQQRHVPIATGRFGADMQVQLINDGPVTFLLQT